MSASVPQWFREALFYEIYPQSFNDSNADGIGDIQGIIEKLEYVQSLGCNALWINPWYESPFIDAGYDVADYRKVASRYGTNTDAKRLFKEAHAHGMHIILDLVPGHTSIEHSWFKKSCERDANEYSNRYIWTRSWTEDDPSLDFLRGYAERDGNVVLNFFYAQPALNYGFAKPDPKKPWQLPTDHPDVLALREEMKDIMRFWLDMGADGFRVDMAGSLVKNDKGQKETIRYWQEVRTLFDRDYPDAVLVSEWSHPERAIAAGFHADYMLHFGMPGYTSLFRHEPGRDQMIEDRGHSFFDIQGKGNIRDFLDYFEPSYKKTKSKGYISLISGNHDLPRISVGRTDDEIEVIFAFLMTMPGVPFIYYGDEIGMRYNPSLKTKEGGFNRTGARTPMQWNSEANAGFSSADKSSLYLPIDTAKDAPTVEQHEQDRRSLLNRLRALTHLRKEHPTLGADARFIPVYAKKNKYPFAYLRTQGAKRYLVVLNPAGREVEAKFEMEKVSAPVLIHGTHHPIKKTKSGVQLTMPAVSFSIWAL